MSNFTKYTIMDRNGDEYTFIDDEDCEYHVQYGIREEHEDEYRDSIRIYPHSNKRGEAQNIFFSPRSMTIFYNV